MDEAGQENLAPNLADIERHIYPEVQLNGIVKKRRLFDWRSLLYSVKGEIQDKVYRL